MATMAANHRKQNLSQPGDGDFDVLDLQHPLSPHTIPEKQPPSTLATKIVPVYERSDDSDTGSDSDNDNDHDSTNASDLMQFTHPLSPHATCPDEQQAQCSNPHDNVKSAATNVVLDAHPLSPHTTVATSFADQFMARTHSISTTVSSTSAGESTFTPSENSTARVTTTGPTPDNDPSAANTTARGLNTTDSTPKTILLINGPNLNLLGYREPHIYGHTTLTDITTNLTTFAANQNIQLQHFQSNHEGQILDRIHACLLGFLPAQQHQHQPSSHESPIVRPDAIIINPGALTHTSVALRDALLGISVPFIEVHISNVHAREEFRHKSFLSDKAEAVICGLGIAGYEAAVRYWAGKWTEKK